MKARLNLTIRHKTRQNPTKPSTIKFTLLPDIFSPLRFPNDNRKKIVIASHFKAARDIRCLQNPPKPSLLSPLSSATDEEPKKDDRQEEEFVNRKLHSIKNFYL
jgi:hypothetical protein